MTVKLIPGSEQKNSCILEQLAGGLFACLSGYWSFPVDLPDQVIEDLRRGKKSEINIKNCKNDANHRYLIFLLTSYRKGFGPMRFQSGHNKVMSSPNQCTNKHGS